MVGRYSVRSFGVRQLAAAFARASLLAGIVLPVGNSREQARGEESGSKLPHSKASQRLRRLCRARGRLVR